MKDFQIDALALTGTFRPGAARRAAVPGDLLPPEIPGRGSSPFDEARPAAGRGCPMLETLDLTIRFGGHVAVDAVSCRFEPGTLTAIVGPNGAGKTTYFNLISGQLPASAGRVLLGGEDLTALPAPLRTRRGLGRAFQLTQLFPNLTVLENVRLAVQAREQGRGHAGALAGALDLLRVWLDRRAWIDEARELARQVQLGDKLDAHAAALPHDGRLKTQHLRRRSSLESQPLAAVNTCERGCVATAHIRRVEELLVVHEVRVVRFLLRIQAESQQEGYDGSG